MIGNILEDACIWELVILTYIYCLCACITFLDSELTFSSGTRKNCTSVMLLYDQFVYIQTFVLSLMSEDEAAILSASQAEMAVIPQSVFMQEDVLLEVLLSGLTVEIVSNFVLDIG